MFVRYWCVGIDLLASEELAKGILNELQPFFTLEQTIPAECLGRLELAQTAAPPGLLERLTRVDGKRIDVDTSLYPHLRSAGTRWELDGDRVTRIDATDTYCAVAGKERAVTLWQPDGDLLCRDAARFLKTALTYGLEARGFGQFHAAAVSTTRGATVIFGDMWQGKTTLVLEMLAAYRCALLAWDTLMIGARPESSIPPVCVGWPSPFSISHGTLADQPDLCAFFPEERRQTPYWTLWKEGKKIRLDGPTVARAYGTDIDRNERTITGAIFAKFQPDQPTRIERVDREELLLQELQKVYLGSRDPIYHNWHDFIDVPSTRIDETIAGVAASLVATVPCYELVWAPSAVSLLNRVDAIASSHRHLGPLLYGA
jgi:hypothetical protein